MLYEIMPVEWEKVADSNLFETKEAWTADTVFGCMKVVAVPRRGDGLVLFGWCCYFDGGEDADESQCHSVEVGKLLAEAVYIKRLRLALQYPGERTQAPESQDAPHHHPA